MADPAQATQTPPQAGGAPASAGSTPPAAVPGQAGGGEPPQKPALDDSHIQAMVKQGIAEGYSGMQSKVDGVLNELSESKKQTAALTKKLETVDNIDSLLQKAEQANQTILNAEVFKLKQQMTAQEFPELVGKETYIQGNTLKDMRASAELVKQDFGIGTTPPSSFAGAPSNTPGTASTQGLQSLSEAEMRETAKNMSNEDLARMTGQKIGNLEQKPGIPGQPQAPQAPDYK
ncbi:hypothetical protein CL633_02440 [bacterium]|nr:hypothetical protein [bacterium]|tara:strand:+ start:909 stop:1604 length:696 start_codon:yes stop_codon:yes gene_type:complete